MPNYSATSKSTIDQCGFGGHTPVFHTVCQILNNSEGMLHFLLRHSADLSVDVRGLIWGRGFEWETFIPAAISKTISILLHHAYNIVYTLPNIPNAYLHSS
jgi:hypothetical protein